MNKTNSILVLLLIAGVVASVFTGSVSLSEIDNIQAFSIMLDVRLPRALMAILVGGALAMSGAVFQIILKNPMADSFTLGMANGAVLGAAVTVVTVIPAAFAPVLSIVLGLASLLAVLLIARKLDLTYRPETLIITGILLGALFSGVLYIIILLFPEDTANIARYMFGSLGGADFSRVSVLLILTSAAFIILERCGRVLDLLKLG